MSERLLEVCCFSASSAVIAEQSGAHRIEFCDNYLDGGTTPSNGNLRWAIENISIPVFPIIRPRGGHFVYSLEEISIIKQDISLCKNLGFPGVVIGFLNHEGMVDFNLTAHCCEWAWPMEVSFHRAFDRVKDPFENLERIIDAGCTRLLTSGQHVDAEAGIDMLIKLHEHSGNRIVLLAGGGIRALNLKTIASCSGITEFHSSAIVMKKSPYYTPDTMQETILEPSVNPEEVYAMVEILKSLD